MVTVGDLTPLFFNPLKNRFGKRIDYIQRFHTSDNILLQFFSFPEENVNAYLTSHTEGFSQKITLKSILLGEDRKLSYINLSSLDEGIYDITIYTPLPVTCEPFEFCDYNSIYDDTSIIQYTHKGITHLGLDYIFEIEDTEVWTDFRFECGFKPENINFHVEQEVFRSQLQEQEQLYSATYNSQILTLGNALGIPWWIASHLNKILNCSHVYINGERFRRSEGSVPEKLEFQENNQTFIYNIELEKAITDPSILISESPVLRVVSEQYLLANNTLRRVTYKSL